MKLTHSSKEIGLLGGENYGQALLASRIDAAGPIVPFHPGPLRHNLPAVEPLKHKRYTQSPKHMTIALGLIGSSGMVFAADTEETWGGDIKTANTKIVSGARAGDGVEPYAIAVTGAGDSDYLQAVKFELIHKTIVNPSWQYAAMAPMTEEFLIEFYRKHVVPFWPHGRNFELLFGVSGRTQGAIWATAESTLRPCVFGSEAIGIGRAYASALLSRFYTPGMSIESCCLLAIHVIRSVKEFIGGCGKQTQIVVLSDGNNILVNQDKIDEAERLLPKALQIHGNVTKFVISASDDLAVTKQAKELKKRLRDIDLLSGAVPTDRSVTISYQSAQQPSQESPGESGES